MRHASIINELADGLLGEAKTTHQQEMLLEELELVSRSLSANRSLYDQATDPILLSEKRVKLIEKALQQEFHIWTTHALVQLMERHLIGEIQELVDRLTGLRQSLKLGRDVEVVSAVPLSKTQLQKIRAHFEKKWDMPIRLKARIDPHVIGGLRVAADSWEFDASVKGRLQALARHLQHS